MRITAVFIITVFVLLNLTVLSQKIFPSHSRPNVLLLVCDTLRADHLGCYGYNRPTSPFMDQFAAEALLFENAMSNAPWTRPSMGSLFTSL
ncbi:MAG: sulfatase-like hydrolase/transferase, partial [Candidatus Aminicenantes bacterium]|nr:sulfatase-like hydrolase/transferase [Candidatus Aminicenantes bacterium]